MLSQFVLVLKIKIKRTFALLLYVRFLFSLSSSLDTCVIVLQMCRPSQTPHLCMSLTYTSAAQRTATIRTPWRRTAEPRRARP